MDAHEQGRAEGRGREGDRVNDLRDDLRAYLLREITHAQEFESYGNPTVRIEFVIPLADSEALFNHIASPPINACLMHRCKLHYNVARMNDKDGGAECGGCVRDDTYTSARHAIRTVLDVYFAEFERVTQNVKRALWKGPPESITETDRNGQGDSAARTQESRRGVGNHSDALDPRARSDWTPILPPASAAEWTSQLIQAAYDSVGNLLHDAGAKALANAISAYVNEHTLLPAESPPSEGDDFNEKGKYVGDRG